MELFIWMGVYRCCFMVVLDDDLHIVCYLFFFTSTPPAQGHSTRLVFIQTEESLSV